MSTEAPTVEEMAMAHLRLSQALMHHAMNSATYKATEVALVRLAEAIAAEASDR